MRASEPRGAAREGLYWFSNTGLCSRGGKRQNGNKSLSHKTYLPKGLTQNNQRFQCSLAQIKNRYPLSGLLCVKTVKTLNGWISRLALTAPTNASLTTSGRPVTPSGRAQLRCKRINAVLMGFTKGRKEI